MKIIITESQYFRLIERRGGHNKTQPEKYLERVKKIHVDKDGNPKYDFSLTDYKNFDTKVKVICPKHREEWLKKTGHEYFEIFPSNLVHGIGCRFCYLEKKTKYSNEDLENEAKKYNTAAQFKKGSFNHYLMAVRRGKDFYQKITSHFVPEKISAGEELVAKILVENGLIDPQCIGSRRCINREKAFEDCKNKLEGQYCRPLRYDFYIPEINTAIEYDGEQHFNPNGKYSGKFEEIQENDKIKNDYCFEKGIKLIRIHYKYPSNQFEEGILNAIKNKQPLTFLGDYSGK